MPRTKDEEREIIRKIKAWLKAYYITAYCTPIHDEGHVRRVAAMALEIADPEKISLFLVELTAWLHNLDRSTHLNLAGEPDGIKRLTLRLLEMFGGDKLTAIEKDLIVDAVLRHDRLNEPDDSYLLQVLKDADRLDEGAIGLLRLSAPKGSPLYTPADFSGVKRSTKSSDITSFVHDIHRCLEWEDMLRLPKAKKFAKSRFGFMRMFLHELECELKEAGEI